MEANAISSRIWNCTVYMPVDVIYTWWHQKSRTMQAKWNIKLNKHSMRFHWKISLLQWWIWKASHHGHIRTAHGIIMLGSDCSAPVFYQSSVFWNVMHDGPGYYWESWRVRSFRRRIYCCRSIEEGDKCFLQQISLTFDQSDSTLCILLLILS